MSRAINGKEFDPTAKAAALGLNSGNPVTGAGKLPTNLASDLSPLSDFNDIPCDKIIPYKGKAASDFKPWSEESFALLVESIEKHGVIEPVTVRPSTDQPGYFEMLAGEHRWQASMKACKRSIPAHVMRECDDERAAHIFSVTNLLRRENSVKDKVNGWWHYTQAIRYKGQQEVDQMVRENIISGDIRELARNSMRQVYRYAKMHDLIEELLLLADQKHLSIKAGEQLAYLSIEQQTDLLEFKAHLNNADKAKQLHELAEGKIKDKSWCREAIMEILFPQEGTKNTSLTAVSGRIKDIIQAKLPKHLYGEAEKIFSDALDAYLKQHPELAENE